MPPGTSPFPLGNHFSLLIADAHSSVDQFSSLLLDPEQLDELFQSYLFPGCQDDNSAFFDDTWSASQFWAEGAELAKPPDISISSGLVDALTELTLSLPPDHPESAPNDRLNNGVILLSPENIERFVRHYFRDWNPHSPILHPATFRSSSASSPILLAVVLTGALFSPSEDEVRRARDMLELAEEYAFGNPIFKKAVSGVGLNSELDLEKGLEALQASFFIAQVQLREGSPLKRKHTRTVRFADIISVRIEKTRFCRPGIDKYRHLEISVS